MIMPNLKQGIERLVNESQQEQLKQFVMDKVFNDQKLIDEARGSKPETPYMFKKGDRVNVINPGAHFDNGEHEIVGFYNEGNVVDENTADPYNTSYGVRLRNSKTGKEYPSTANNIELAKLKQFQPTKETIWNDPKHPLYGIPPSNQNEKFLKMAIEEMERDLQSPAHFKFYTSGSGATMGGMRKALNQYKKALKYIQNYK